MKKVAIQKKKLPLHPALKAKKKRKSVVDAQDARVAKKAADEHKKKAHKRATTLFAAEQKKAGRGRKIIPIILLGLKFLLSTLSIIIPYYERVQ